MKILITGGSGFIGSNLVEHFVSRGNEVLNLDIAKPRNVAHIDYWQDVDILDGKNFHTKVNDFLPDHILHMGARTDLQGNSVRDYTANTIGVENLLTVLKDVTSIKRVIFASSRLVCRIGYTPKDEYDFCPSTPYGESKVIGEKIIREAIPHLTCTILIVRPTSIWGPWFDIPYKTFFISIAKNRYVHPGNHKVFKSFGFVLNTVHQLEKLLNAPMEDVNHKTFYLADYPPIEISSFANLIQEKSRSKPIKNFNVHLLMTLAWCGDLAKFMGWINPPITSFRLNNILTEMVHDLSSLETIAGNLPYTLDEGVKITVEWLRTQGYIS